MSKDFAAGPDYPRDYQAQLAKAVQAWSDPAAWDRELTVMGNAMNASDVGAMLVMEMVLHGWDIARATGQDYHCDGELAGALLATVSAQADMFRQYQGFAPVVPVPDDAPAFDRAVAAWSEPEAWDRELGVMGTPTPSADVGALLVAEMVLHGWDIARATGQDFHCDGPVLAATAQTVAANAELFRQYQGFAAPVELTPEAPEFDRMLATSGRDPAWTAQ